MNIKNVNNVYGQYINPGSARGKISSKSFIANGVKPGVKQDSLSFSSEAALIRNNAAAVRRCASEITSGASDERINTLRQQIQSGEYNVDAKKVANSILDRYV